MTSIVQMKGTYSIKNGLEFKDGDEDTHFLSKLEVYIDEGAVEEIVAKIRSRFPEAIIFESEIFCP